MSGRGGRYPYDLAHHPVTAALTNAEYEQLKVIATTHGIPPSTYATKILRRELEHARHPREDQRL